MAPVRWPRLDGAVMRRSAGRDGDPGPRSAGIPREIVLAGLIPAGGWRKRNGLAILLLNLLATSENEYLSCAMPIREITGQGLAAGAGQLSRLRPVAECSRPVLAGTPVTRRKSCGNRCSTALITVGWSAGRQLGNGS